MSKNTNLHGAKRAKNDEFYTQLTDIEKELKHYKRHFRNKVVFCNCDDPEWSNFWRYFALNFKELGLKKLIATHYDPDKPTYKIEYVGGPKDEVDFDESTNKLKYTGRQPKKISLAQNGKFQCPECVELLKEADIVVTNPPFSLFREYVAQLVEHGKKFLIIGNMNAITYKEIFSLLKENVIYLGVSYPKEFVQPDGTIKKFGNINWYTNLDHKKRHEELILYKTYTPQNYPTYDNYDAIEVSKVKNIPLDYDGAMGVPISFMDKYNPEQFEIIGRDRELTNDNKRGFVDSKEKYARIIIRNRNPQGTES